MHANDPRRNLIQSWPGDNCVQIFIDPRTAPRWVLNKGALRNPCDWAGCKRHILKGEWYVRHPEIGIVCSDCASRCGLTRPVPSVP